MRPFSKLLPYGVALALFLALTMLYFAPQYAGKTLIQHDVMQYKGMTQDILEHRATFGEDPQWEGNMFGGMPSYLINFEYGGTFVRTLSQAFYFLGEPASLIFIAMVMFFSMLLCMGVAPWVSIVPALGYGLSTYFFVIIGAGHITKMMAMAFVPMLFGGVYLAFRGNRWLGAALAAFFASIVMGVNHPQITYYFALVLAAFWINEGILCWRAKTLNSFTKTTATLLLAAALAVGSNAGMIWYASQHASETMRGGTELTTPVEGEITSDKGLDLAYATNWSYGKIETLNLLIPNLYGGSSEGGFSADGKVAQSLTPYQARNMATVLPAYWGDQPITSGPVYIGAVMLFLATLGLFLLQGRRKWWIVTVSLLAIFLAWGHNMLWFTELFFNYFPIYNKFRTVSMILVIVEWTVPLLAALTLCLLWQRKLERAVVMQGLKRTVILFSSILGLVLIASTIGLFSFSGSADSQLPTEVAAAMQDERASMLQSDTLRALLFALLSAGLVWAFVAGKLKQSGFVAILSLLVIADMVPVNLRYLSQNKFVPAVRAEIQPSAADQQILQDTTLGYRVLNLTVSPFNDASTSYFHRSVGGYHGAKLQRYQDLIERHLSQMNLEVYNLLNTKYIISSDKTTNTPVVQLNAEANGAAWFVDRVEWVDSPDAEITALGGLNSKTTAVVDRKFESQVPATAELSADSMAVIHMTEYRVNLQKYSYTAPRDGIALFSEIYYPHGWTAYVDGIEAPYFRADYVLRAMQLPAGSHTVEFRFRAPDYNRIVTATATCSILILLGVLLAVTGTLYVNRKK